MSGFTVKVSLSCYSNSHYFPGKEASEARAGDGAHVQIPSIQKGEAGGWRV